MDSNLYEQTIQSVKKNNFKKVCCTCSVNLLKESSKSAEVTKVIYEDCWSFPLILFVGASVNAHKRAE